MKRPSLDASESEILAFARDWVRFAARHGLDEALRLIDRRDNEPEGAEAGWARMLKQLGIAVAKLAGHQ